jgi:hypothetical protein
MKGYEIMARRAEEWASRGRNMDDILLITKKDGKLSKILGIIDWMSRLPGSEEDKKPYTKRMWKAYLSVQEGLDNDKTIVPQIIGGESVEYIEDQAVEHSIADSGIGTGGLGYSSIQEQSIGTQYRQKPKDPYWNDKIPKSECRTLEGEEKWQAYLDHLASLNHPIEEGV